jgi:hypothetical protein
MTGQSQTSDGCYVCGSDDLYDVEAVCETGVTSPDGGKEYRRAVVTRCRACGAMEER